MSGNSSKRVNELTYALAVMRATLEATADGILVIDQYGQITSLNKRFVEIWKIPQELVALRDTEKIQAFVAQQFMEPERYLARVAQIGVTEGRSVDLLKLANGNVIERHSENISIEERRAGRVW